MPELGIGLESGLGLENLTATEMNNSSLIARCIWWKLQAHAIGHSDHSDRVSIHRLPNKKAYTERVDCSPTDILLAEIVNQFISSAILAAMISSVEMHGKTG